MQGNGGVRLDAPGVVGRVYRNRGDGAYNWRASWQSQSVNGMETSLLRAIGSCAAAVLELTRRSRGAASLPPNREPLAQ